MFELGVATALNRPVLIITPRGLPDLPPEVADVPRLSVEVLGSDEFDEAVHTLLRRRERRPAARRQRRSRPLGGYADTLLQRVAEIGSEADLADVVSEALQKSGAELIRESALAERRRVDVIAWHEGPHVARRESFGR